MIKFKEKKERSLGERLGLKGERCNSPKCALVRKPYRPGVHGQKRRRNLSDFGRQIMEKQKFKVSYGLKESNLRQLFLKAQKEKGSTATNLISLLERRLDNTIFRLGFASSRASARQLISHGHILVNNRRVHSPGFLVKVDNSISIREDSKKLFSFAKLKESLKKYEPPTWLILDKEKIEGKVLKQPDDLTPPFEVNLLVESFSK